MVTSTNNYKQRTPSTDSNTRAPARRGTSNSGPNLLLLGLMLAHAGMNAGAALTGTPVNDPALIQMGARLRPWLEKVAAPTPPNATGADATLVLSYDPLAGSFELGRREQAQGDGPEGVVLARAAKFARPAITGDGSVALFVGADNDLCVVLTADPESRECLGVPGRIKSVAVAPDGKLAAFVLRDPQTRAAESQITVYELASNSFYKFGLALPIAEGATAEKMLSADFMAFNSDGSALIYDASCRIKFGDEPAEERWSLYSLRLATGNTSMVVPPLKGLDTANPAINRVDNRYIAFDAYHPGTEVSTILVLDVTAGQTGKLGAVQGFGYPSFTGDGTGVIFSVPDPEAEVTGYSLLKQDLSADRLTKQGDPTLWFKDVDMGVVYRRAAANPSNALPTVTLTLSADRLETRGRLTMTATAEDRDGVVIRVEFYDGATKLGETERAPYTFVWNNVPAGNHLLKARAIDNLGGSQDSVPRFLTVSGQSAPEKTATLRIEPLAKHRVRLTVNGEAGDYIIAISQNLVEWSDLYPVKVDASGVGVVEDSGGPMNHAILFYKVRRAAD